MIFHVTPTSPRFAIGQVWNDLERRYKPRRQIRIDRLERRGLMRVAKISARQGDEPWRPVIRYIRLDRLPKRFRLNQDT